jgi:hypothetical protein
MLCLVTYNGGTWSASAIPTINTLDDIGDVDTSGVTQGQVLAYNGATWSPVTISADITAVNAGTGLTGGGITGDVTLTLDANLSNLNDVVFGVTPSEGDVLTYNGGTWSSSAIPTIETLSDVGDVYFGLTPSDGQVLTYNGGTWSATTIIGGVTDITAGQGLTANGTTGSIEIQSLGDVQINIPEGTTVSVAADYQHLVYGPLTVDGYLDNDGKVIVINGELLGDGIINNIGNVEFINFAETSYVDQAIAGLSSSSISEVIAGVGLTGGGDVGAVTLTLDANLSNLNDVIFSATPSNGEVLTYDNGSWTASAIPTINALNDIGDVDTSGVITGQVLQYDGATWSPATISADITAVNAGTGLTGGGLSGDVTLTLDANISNLNDVVFGVTPSNGQVLTYNGGTWSASAIPTINELSDIGDVEFGATPSNGQVLSYNGGTWSASTINVTKVIIDESNSGNTLGNGSSTGITISSTPINDSYPSVFINGILQHYGVGASGSNDVYFSNDGGTTARAIADVVAGDTLYFNGTVNGFDLDTNDLIQIKYEVGV